MTAKGGDVYGEGIATAGPNVHVIFGNSDVQHRSSPDQDTTWSNDRTLDTGVIHLTEPIVSDGAGPPTQRPVS